LSARVENSGELGWVFGCSLGGELQFGKEEEGETEEESVGIWAYNGFFRWHHRQITFVDDSVGDSATSLYDYLSLNPSINPSVKSSDVTTPLHISRQIVYPVGETVGIYRWKYFVDIYRPFHRRVEAVGIYQQILR
jgi:hypothetical protein